MRRWSQLLPGRILSHGSPSDSTCTSSSVTGSCPKSSAPSSQLGSMPAHSPPAWLKLHSRSTSPLHLSRPARAYDESKVDSETEGATLALPRSCARSHMLTPAGMGWRAV
eukprot:scaffold8418_cov106-Isochrysis_galbana.AAC.10